MTLRAKLARRVAVRRLDLDDIYAKIAKLLCRIRTEHDGRAIENSYTGQGPGQIAPPRCKRPPLISGRGLCVLAQAAIRSFLRIAESARPNPDGAGPTT